MNVRHTYDGTGTYYILQVILLHENVKLYDPHYRFNLIKEDFSSPFNGEVGRGLSRHNILGLCRILRGATFCFIPIHFVAAFWKTDRNSGEKRRKRIGKCTTYWFIAYICSIVEPQRWNLSSILLITKDATIRRYLRHWNFATFSYLKIMQRLKCLRWWIVFPPLMLVLGRELVYAYLTGVGFLVVAYLSEGQSETPRRWVSNQ